ncbi:hypothetical protein [Lysobacter terrae]
MKEMTIQEVEAVSGGLTAGEFGGIMGGGIGSVFGIGGGIIGAIIGTEVGNFFSRSSSVNAWNTDSRLNSAMLP